VPALQLETVTLIDGEPPVTVRTFTAQIRETSAAPNGLKIPERTAVPVVNELKLTVQLLAVIVAAEFTSSQLMSTKTASPADTDIVFSAVVAAAEVAVLETIVGPAIMQDLTLV
jgi:hypothetical protein